jgi:hypothetical protein
VPDGTSGYGGIRAGLLQGPGYDSAVLIASVVRLLRFASGAKYEGRSPRVRVENALLILSQMEWVFGRNSRELYLVQDGWFMQKAMGKGLDRLASAMLMHFAASRALNDSLLHEHSMILFFTSTKFF